MQGPHAYGPFVQLNAEYFKLQRTYLFMIAQRDDMPPVVKGNLELIEIRLSLEAGVESIFDKMRDENVSAT